MAALRLDGIFPEINETGIMPGLFEMEGQIGIVFQGNNDAFFISFYILDIDLPGFRKEDIKAELNDGYLTISADRSCNKASRIPSAERSRTNTKVIVRCWPRAKSISVWMG
jgi:HSP20 family protein